MKIRKREDDARSIFLFNSIDKQTKVLEVEGDQLANLGELMKLGKRIFGQSEDELTETF